MFGTNSSGQNNKFILSPKVGFTLVHNQNFIDSEKHSAHMLFAELDLQYRMNQFGIGLKTSTYRQNSVTYSDNLAQGVNPNVHEYFIYGDPWWQSNLHFNYWIHTLYGCYSFDLGKKFSADLRTGISWVYGVQSRIDLIADGDFKPTRTSYRFSQDSEPDWYKSLEFNYQITNNKRIGIGINESFYRWATYASFGVSF